MNDVATKPDVKPYAVGIMSASVCAHRGLSADKIEQALNDMYPTGIDSRWTLSSEAHFASGEPQPCPCNTEPETRVHFLLEC